MKKYNKQGQPIELEEWARLLEDDTYRQVALDTVGELVVSTIWLGIDHRFVGEGPPLIFETIIAGGVHYEERTSTEANALAQHARAVAHAKGLL